MFPLKYIAQDTYEKSVGLQKGTNQMYQRVVPNLLNMRQLQTEILELLSIQQG